ncbi:hypothetical protein ACFQY0_17515 [Haloferula chungangensis]|uniref:Uncharacterized protein n=1 Tax=Haloferula chungangensis TaxID=1048331 RepID=A0ABW2L991_9BACT
MKLLSLAAGFTFTLLPVSLLASVTFDFADGNNLDDQGIGASIQLTDGATSPSTDITLSTIDIQGQDGSLASTGTANTTHSTSESSLGVASLTNTGGYENEARDFNRNEAWSFTFDVDVKLVEIDFDDWNSGAAMTLTSSAFAAKSFSYLLSNSGTFSLSNTVVPAGTTVTLKMISQSNDLGVFLKYLKVEAVQPPPPGIIFSDGDGGDWTTTEANFTENGLPKIFVPGEDVIFPAGGNLAVRVEEAGISAGSIIYESNQNGTLKFLLGDLTTSSTTSVGRGTIAVQNKTTISGTATALSNGKVEVLDGGNLTVGAISLGGGSDLIVEAGGTLNPAPPLSLNTGGADIYAHADITLGAVSNSIDENSLDKFGDGTLTLTDGMGTITTGPVRFDIEAGNVIVQGSTPVNIGGIMTFNGSFIMEGPEVELHASDITGTGSIVVRSSSMLSPRFNDGDSIIEVPIIIEEGQTLSIDPSSNSNTEVYIKAGLSGPGNFNKLGNGLCFFQSPNEGYDGSTTVSGGTLRMADPSLNDFSPIYLSGTGKLDLRHGVEDVVHSLFIDGVQLEAGTYGSSSVTGGNLTQTNDVNFSTSGTGWLRVVSGPASAEDYEGWSGPGGYNLSGGPDDDDDQDGVANGDEYAFGLDPTSAASTNPIASTLDPTSGKFSYTRRNRTLYSTGLTYIYEYSLNLKDDWERFPNTFSQTSDNGDPVETITVTLPSELLSNDALFIRVNVH